MKYHFLKFVQKEPKGTKIFNIFFLFWHCYYLILLFDGIIDGLVKSKALKKETTISGIILWSSLPCRIDIIVNAKRIIKKIGASLMVDISQNNIETEVKFLINDPKELRLKLKSMGIDSPGSIFEKNYRYDDPHSSLLKNKRLLRLRSDQKNILTFKKPSSIKNADFKINEEIEVEVSDFDQMEKILNEIGFLRVQSYEKHRETFVLKDAKILIDNMPYGTFIEIEGTEESIRNYVSILDLDWDKRITLNYLEIFENISKRLKLSFRDVTFENFEQIITSFCIDPSDLGIQTTR